MKRVLLATALMISFITTADAMKRMSQEEEQAQKGFPRVTVMQQAFIDNEKEAHAKKRFTFEHEGKMWKVTEVEYQSFCYLLEDENKYRNLPLPSDRLINYDLIYDKKSEIQAQGQFAGNGVAVLFYIEKVN